MNKEQKDHRDRLIALGFVSLLLIVIYGPASGWFVAVDHFIYDQIAGRIEQPRPADSVIVSIDPAGKSAAQVAAEYQRLLGLMRENKAARLVLANPPEMDASGDLSAWTTLLAAGPPVFVPSRHPLATIANRSGYLDIRPDSDGILRRSNLWYLNNGVMSPSLPLAIALANLGDLPAANLVRNDAAMYVGRYSPLARLSAAELLAAGNAEQQIAGKTVFIDADLPLVSAAAQLPSRQYVTPSETTAAMLGSLESGRAITAPSWSGIMELLTPAILAVLAILLLPGHSRRQIVLTTAVAVTLLLLVELLLLTLANTRFDLGRPIIVLASASLVSAWLAGAVRNAAQDAFQRGSDFLSAGRLEPAFAEFRRCEPTETVANAMYKLSLAFEDQALPERADAVLSWMKETQGATTTSNDTPGSANGTPKRLGRYVIEKKLGRGAMGAVYLARDPRINRAVALKVIPIEKEFEDEELKEARLRFFREAESAGRLTHPDIITVYDCGEDKHLAYIAMEYLQGTSLIYFKDPKKLLAPRKALELCARVADALDYAHNAGVIHRDIKPANLLYNARDGVLKISDFGVARLTDNNRTKTGIVLGTPMYMSPEQLGAEKLTGHSDLFSLGVTLYELLTGEVPFKASNIALLMKKITSEDPAPVSNRRPGVPPSVDTVLFKALAKRPQDRFANGAEMAIALRNCAKYAST